MRKKGQVTIFVIIGLIIIMLSAITYYVLKDVNSRESSTDFSKVTSFNTKNIENYYNSCVEQVAQNGLITIGIQGGYTKIPLVIQKENTAYWYYEGINIQPSLEQINERLNTYITKNIGVCFDDIFEKDGYNITIKEEPIAEAKFTDSNTIILVKMLIIIQKDNYQKNIDFIQVPSDIRFKKIFNVARDIVNEETKTGVQITEGFYKKNQDSSIQISYEKSSDSMKITVSDTYKNTGFNIMFENYFG